MKRMLAGVLVVVALAVSIGGWWLYQSLDSLVATAIRSYGPRITGVPVKLAQVKIYPADGAATFEGIELANPAGFKTASALALGQISVKLDVASITKDVVRIQEVTLLQPEVTYEYASGGSNLDVIERNVKQFAAEQGGSKTGAASDGDKGKEKKLIIDNLYIKGARANVSASFADGKSITVPLRDIHLKDIGKKSGGASPAEVTQQVIAAVSKEAAQAGTSVKNVVGGAVEDAVSTVKGLFK
jgi:hypothetical protein